MYSPKDIQHVGKHDYDKHKAKEFATYSVFVTFSIGIFQWEMKANGKEMKRGPVKVRVRAFHKDFDRAVEVADRIVRELDEGVYEGPMKVDVKSVVK